MRARHAIQYPTRVLDAANDNFSCIRFPNISTDLLLNVSSASHIALWQRKHYNS